MLSSVASPSWGRALLLPVDVLPSNFQLESHQPWWNCDQEADFQTLVGA